MGFSSPSILEHPQSNEHVIGLVTVRTSTQLRRGMLSLPQRLTASGQFSGPNTPGLGRFLSSKPARVTCAVLVALALLLLSGSLYAGHGNRSAAAATAANTVPGRDLQPPAGSQSYY